jgi:hypothetical protein
MSGQTQFKPQTQERELSKVERFLEVRFSDSKIDNAVLLITAVAHKLFNTAVMPVDVRDILTAYFYHDADDVSGYAFAEAEVLLKNGIVLRAFLSIEGKDVKSFNFRVDSIHRSDCYCGE